MGCTASKPLVWNNLSNKKQDVEPRAMLEPGGGDERTLPLHLFLFANPQPDRRSAASKILDMKMSLIHMHNEAAGSFTVHIANMQISHKRQDAMNMISKLVANGTARVRAIVFGGDNTVKWVVQELDKTGVRGVPIGIVPCGRLNYLSQQLGWGATTPDPFCGYGLSKLNRLLGEFAMARVSSLPLWKVTAVGSSIEDSKILAPKRNQGSFGSKVSGTKHVNVGETGSDNKVQLVRHAISHVSIGSDAQFEFIETSKLKVTKRSVKRSRSVMGLKPEHTEPGFGKGKQYHAKYNAWLNVSKPMKSHKLVKALSVLQGTSVNQDGTQGVPVEVHVQNGDENVLSKDLEHDSDNKQDGDAITDTSSKDLEQYWRKCTATEEAKETNGDDNTDMAIGGIVDGETTKEMKPSQVSIVEQQSEYDDASQIAIPNDSHVILLRNQPMHPDQHGNVVGGLQAISLCSSVQAEVAKTKHWSMVPSNWEDSTRKSSGMLSDNIQAGAKFSLDSEHPAYFEVDGNPYKGEHITQLNVECERYINVLLPMTPISTKGKQRTLAKLDSKAPKRTFDFDVTEALSSYHVFMLVNPSSGGNQAGKLINMNIQVLKSENLGGDSGCYIHFCAMPDPEIRESTLQTLKQLSDNLDQASQEQIRVIACGGDGTVKWVISAMESVGIPSSIPVGVIPFGTGNDMSRILGWGGSAPLELLGPKLAVLTKLVKRYLVGKVIPLDVWKVEVQLESDGKCEVVKQRKVVDDNSIDDDKCIKHFMINYVSVGADAQVGFDFEITRRKSQLANLAQYALLGSLQAIHVPPSLGTFIAKVEWQKNGNQIYENFLEDDGDVATSESTNGKDFPPKARAMIVQNIPSYSGGVNLWNGFRSTQPPHKVGLGPQYVSDGLSELVCIASTQTVGANIATGGLAKSVTSGIKRLAQSEAYTMEFKPRSKVYFQVDGESCRLHNPRYLKVTKAYQVHMVQSLASASLHEIAPSQLTGTADPASELIRTRQKLLEAENRILELEMELSKQKVGLSNRDKEAADVLCDNLETNLSKVGELELLRETGEVTQV